MNNRRAPAENVEPQPRLRSISGQMVNIFSVVASLAHRDLPPPPYEDPPSYAAVVAITRSITV